MKSEQAHRGQGIVATDFRVIRQPFTQFQTWLGDTGGSEGCPINCTYCFFKLDGQTPKKPILGLSPQEIVDLVDDAYTYHEDMPINFASQTDVFATKDNIKYYSEVLKRFGESGHKNPLIFISKRSIPDDFMRLALDIPQPVLFYMSYSGLGGSPLEPTVSSEHIRDNFVRLKAYGLPAIHYWRPFTPHNSDEITLRRILDHVSEYATCSVINGLRLNDGIMNNIRPFWPELGEAVYDFKHSGEFWPEGVREYLKQLINREYPDYPVFFGNTPCTITYALETGDTAGLLHGRMCNESQCPVTQRERCVTKYRVPSESEVLEALAKMEINPEQVEVASDRIVVSGKVDTGKIVYLKTRLKFPIVTGDVGYEGGHNWANVNDETGVIELPWKGNWLRDKKVANVSAVESTVVEQKEPLNNYPLKTIILAGGRGKRLESVTNGTIPKCFVEIDQKTGKRGIDYVEEMFVSLGLRQEDVVFSADYYYRQYEEALRQKKRDYTMLYQWENVGNGGAVEQAIREYGLGYQYLVISPDTYYSESDLAHLIRNHKPGTVSWGVGPFDETMKSYHGLVVDSETQAILGDTKLAWWKDYPLKGTEQVVKGAIQIFDPVIYLRSLAVFKKLCKKDYPIDLYWDVCPLLEEENRRRILRGQQSILQAVQFKDKIIDFGTPDRLDYVKRNFKF